MANPTAAAIACPHCGAPGEAEIWTNVNNAENPDAAQWLIDGFLFQYECPACGHVATLNHDCIFNDAKAKALVLYAADRTRAQDALAALEQRAPEGYRVRFVHTQDELREKAALFRDGLDDRAVEVAKLAAFNRFAETGELPASTRAFFGALDENGDIIVEFVTETGTTETAIPRSLYDSIAASFTSLQPSIVDRAWATQVLANWE